MNLILYIFTDQAPLLPRYKYHCLLLDQLRNGIPKDKDFNKWTFNDSPFTVVGNVNKKQRHDLFKNSLEERLSTGIKEEMLPCCETKNTFNLIYIVCTNIYLLKYHKNIILFKQKMSSAFL